MTISQTVVSIAALIGVVAGPAFAAINIETVPVGNAGNAADSRYGGYGGYGSVGYTYNIGKYEVTAGQYTAFLNAVAGVDTYGLYNTSMWTGFFSGCRIERYAGNGSAGNPYQYRVANNAANRPVNYVSWGDAARFANWLHNNQPTGAQDASTTERGAYTLDGATSATALMAVNRNSNWKWAITSEDEWYKAAYHKNDGPTGNYFDYPTNSDSVPSNDLINPDPGNNANFNQDGYTIDSPYWRTEVGEFENSDSPYGTFDQGGNVWEWNEEAVFYSSRGVRGGSFNDDDGSLHASNFGYYYPAGEGYYLGFRVSEIPEPASAIILIPLGGSLLAASRRRKFSAAK